jgi:segregation and condensation protein B
MEAIGRLEIKYRSADFAIEIVASGGGFLFLTKPAFQGILGSVLKQKVKKRLSTSAMETLSIIAYRQPISKPELEKIRGVNCDYAVQKLLEKELIVLAGKSDQPGRPILYATSQKFMDYFGINHLGDLPQLKEMVAEENSVGVSEE